MFNSDFILSMVRHLLTLGAGVLVTKGTIDQSTAEQLVGAVMTIGVAAWSWIHHVGPSK